jgi:hypothetical protein
MVALAPNEAWIPAVAPAALPAATLELGDHTRFARLVVDSLAALECRSRMLRGPTTTRVYVADVRGELGYLTVNDAGSVSHEGMRRRGEVLARRAHAVIQRAIAS